MEFLEFEVPIKEILDQIDKCKSIENESDVDITKTYNLLQKSLLKQKKISMEICLHGKEFNFQGIQIDLTP